jgi:hypothetical protein
MLIFAFLLSVTTPYQSGLASRYHDPKDRYENFRQPLACEQRIKKKRGLVVWKTLSAVGVAHRHLPCGAQVTICTKKKCIRAYIVDRGPYGAIDKQGKWHRRNKLLPGERWRGIVDLLPPITNELGITGLSKVYI